MNGLEKTQGQRPGFQVVGLTWRQLGWEGGYETMRMTPYHAYFRGSQPCCKPESPTMLVKSRCSGINPDFSNLNFQKGGMELSAHIAHSTKHTKEFYQQTSLGNTDPRSYLWVLVTLY